MPRLLPATTPITLGKTSPKHLLGEATPGNAWEVLQKLRNVIR